MQLFITNSTNRMGGGQVTTMLVDDFVNSKLGNYGSAVEKVLVTLLYPTRHRSGTKAVADSVDFQKRLKQCPRVRFFREKKLVKISQICRGVNPMIMIGDEHLSFAETERLVATVADVLELMRPRFRPADNFDCDKFIVDARDALIRCPKAIRRFLA